MDRNILECLDCHETFNDTENHMCKEVNNSYFISKPSIQTEYVERVAEERVKYAKSTGSEDGKWNSLHSPNNTQETFVSKDMKFNSKIITEQNILSAMPPCSSSDHSSFEIDDKLQKAKVNEKTTLQVVRNTPSSSKGDDNMKSIGNNQTVRDSQSPSSPSVTNATACTSVLDVESSWCAKEKHFVCPECGRGLCTKTKLVKHYRIHTGEKPYSCDKCERKFSQKGHLNRHRRSHTGEDPFKCSICEEVFTRYYHLKLHYESAHNME